MASHADKEPPRGRDSQEWLVTVLPVATALGTLTGVWLGKKTWSAALRSQDLHLHGDRSACSALPRWQV